MKKESRAVSSRDDGEGSCSQEKSPTRRSVVGVVVSSRRYRDPGAGAREGVLRAKIRRPPLPALAHPWPSLLELELLQDARTPLAGEVARAASGTPCSSCPAAARCAVRSHFSRRRAPALEAPAVPRELPPVRPARAPGARCPRKSPYDQPCSSYSVPICSNLGLLSR
jgi:hypothetical protein